VAIELLANQDSSAAPLSDEVKSGLLSTSFASWRKTKNPYPLFIPDAVKGALPVPLADANKFISSAPPGAAREAARKRMHRDLTECQHRAKDSFAQAALRPAGVAPVPPLPKDDPASVRHFQFVDTQFDEGSMTTSITVFAQFTLVKEHEAQTILANSRPENWSKAVPDFFKRSTPGEWDSAASKFVPFSEIESLGSSFQILEFVNWVWAPSSSGGIINVLDVKSSDVDAGLADEVLMKTKVPNDIRDRPEYSPVSGSTQHVAYEYSLNRCLQSKFLSTWEVGGLDVDEGSFQALWSPNETLSIKAVKRLRYSDDANIVPGFTSMLNLLAPALTNMLMKQLSHDSVLKYLMDSRAAAAKRNAFAPQFASLQQNTY
jgi:hypothetical protein